MSATLDYFRYEIDHIHTVSNKATDTVFKKTVRFQKEKTKKYSIFELEIFSYFENERVKELLPWDNLYKQKSFTQNIFKSLARLPSLNKFKCVKNKLLDFYFFGEFETKKWARILELSHIRWKTGATSKNVMMKNCQIEEKNFHRVEHVMEQSSEFAV